MRVLFALWLLLALGSCRPGASARISPMEFDSATAWIHQDSDSTRLSVEIASSTEQHERGLSGRPFLEEDSGMVFQFEGLRSGDDGFWMVGAQIPLDIAFMDEAGTILRILSMDVCEGEFSIQSCPGYFPGVDYSSALETNRDWFARNGVATGARVVVVP